VAQSKKQLSIGEPLAFEAALGPWIYAPIDWTPEG
jgi:hypothetical protein